MVRKHLETQINDYNLNSTLIFLQRNLLYFSIVLENYD